MSQAIILQCFINGLSMGLTYALMALGLTLVFGMMHIVNFAHGELLMLGGFCVYYLSEYLGLNYFVGFFSDAVHFGPLRDASRKVGFPAHNRTGQAADRGRAWGFPWSS